MPIANDRRDKFVWISGDLVFEDKISIPDNLKQIIENIPDDDQQGLAYLRKLVKINKISIDEFRFILNVITP